MNLLAFAGGNHSPRPVVAKFDSNLAVFLKSEIKMLTGQIGEKIRVMAIWWRKIMLAAYFDSLARSRKLVVHPPSVILPVSIKLKF